MSSDDTKQCPYCAETIKAAAIVCRYCGRDLTTPLPPSSAMAVQPTIPAQLKLETPKKKGGCFSSMLYLALIIGGFIALVIIISVVRSAGEAAGILPTRTPTHTPTITPTPTDTPTPTNTPLPTDTPTITPTPLPTNTPTITPTPTNTVPPTATPVPTNTPVPTEPPTPTPPPAVGMDVIVGDIRWKVLSAENLGDVLKSDNQFIDDLTTAGMFIKVLFEVENRGKNPVSFSSVDLADAQDRTHHSSSDAIFFIEDEERCVLESLNPDIPRNCTIIFEVPKNATGLKAFVGDFMPFGDDAKIDLGL